MEGDINMKRVIMSLLLVLVILAIPSMVIASDISDAIYYGTILVSNNGTAATSVAVNCTINGTALQDIYGVDSDYTYTALRSSSGSDIPYMPGDENWIMYISNIGQDSNLNYIIYTGNSSLDSKQYIFSNSSGTIVPDDATLEGGSNFSVNASGVFVDSSLDIAKDGAVKTISDSSGNVTAILYAISSWTSPTSYTDPSSGWTNETNAYDGNQVSYATSLTAASSWSSYLQLGLSTYMSIDKIYVRASRASTPGVPIEVDCYVDGSWVNSIDATLSTDTLTTLYFDNVYYTDEIRVRLYNTYAGGSQNMYFNEIYVDSSTFTSCQTTIDEHDIAASANTTHWNLYVDDVLQDSTTLSGASMPDNSNDWTVKAFYLYQFDIDVSGSNVCKIRWENDTTFTDLSGNGNDATPTLRTASSDTNVSAALVTFSPIDTAIAPGYTVSDAPDFYSGNVTTSGQFTFGNPSITGGPAGFQLINDVSTQGGVPPIVVWCIIAICIIGCAGLFMAWMQRRYGFRSMWPYFIAGILPIALLVALGGDVKIFDFWMVLFYCVIFFSLMTFSRHGDLGGNVTTHGLIGFLAQSWIGLTVINKILEGNFIGSTETAWINNFAFTQDFKLFNLFSVPVLNLDFFTKGIPSLLRWDYSFFGGNAQMFQYLLYSLTAVVTFVIFTIIIGLLYNFFRGR